MSRPSVAAIRLHHQPKDEPPAWRWARVPSAYVTAALYPTRVSADTVSWVHLGLLLSAAALMAVGTWPTAVAASVVLVLSYVADNVDGELARARHATSSHGKWIERTAHYYGERALILGAALGGHAEGHDLWWLVAPIALLVFEVYLELLRLNNDRRRHRVRPAAPRDSGDEGGSRGNLARRLLQSGWLFQFRPLSTNLWIVVGLFHLVYETLLLTTVLRLLAALGFLMSHLLLSRRRASAGPTS